MASDVLWIDAARHTAFERWLARVAPAHGLLLASVRTASADASFRRYLRVDGEGGASFIIMDAPPAHENCAPFVHVARLMQEAGVRAPRVLDWEQADGFMLMTDLGQRTMLEGMDWSSAQANAPRYEQALDALLRWQQASRAGDTFNRLSRTYFKVDLWAIYRLVKHFGSARNALAPVLVLLKNES